MSARRNHREFMTVEPTYDLAHTLPGRRSRKSGERGSALIEYAFTFVISMVLIFAMIDFARALYSYHFVNNAAREGARFASVRGVFCSASATPCPADGGDIYLYVQQIVPLGIDASKVHVNPSWPATSMPICGTQGYPGCPVAVQVTYQFNYIFPAPFYNLAPVMFQAAHINMSSTAQMIISR